MQSDVGKKEKFESCLGEYVPVGFDRTEVF